MILLETISDLGWQGIVLSIIAAIVIIEKKRDLRLHYYLLPILLGFVFYGALNYYSFMISISPGIDMDLVSAHKKANANLILSYSAFLTFIIIFLKKRKMLKKTEERVTSK